jgi:pumilio RNA-binding family
MYVLFLYQLIFGFLTVIKVIQKLIERVSADRLGFVNSFRGNVYDLSTHPYGCRVLQRCLEHLPEERSRPLLDELHRHAINLMQDQFGVLNSSQFHCNVNFNEILQNYVIQFLLENRSSQDRAQIIAKLRGQMLNMSRHKFASNVCEKALVTADPETRRILIDELMTPKADGVNPIMLLMKDQFGSKFSVLRDPNRGVLTVERQITSYSAR